MELSLPSPIVLAHTEINDPFWMAINWNWDPRRDAWRDIWSITYIQQFDKKYVSFALMFVPAFYLIYLPLAPLVSFLLLVMGFIYGSNPTLINSNIPEEVRGFLVSLLYLIRYVLRLGYSTPHNQVLNQTNTFELFGFNMFANLFGIWSFNLMYPLTFLMILWDIAIAVIWVIEHGVKNY